MDNKTKYETEKVEKTKICPQCGSDDSWFLWTKGNNDARKCKKCGYRFLVTRKETIT